MNSVLKTYGDMCLILPVKRLGKIMLKSLYFMSRTPNMASITRTSVESDILSMSVLNFN